MGARHAQDARRRARREVHEAQGRLRHARAVVAVQRADGRADRPGHQLTCYVAGTRALEEDVCGRRGGRRGTVGGVDDREGLRRGRGRRVEDGEEDVAVFDADHRARVSFFPFCVFSSQSWVRLVLWEGSSRDLGSGHRRIQY